MRANDLVWRYVVSNWYQGKEPPAFDILAWNADSTRLPAAMHAQFLRMCYLHNELTHPGAAVVDGAPIDLTNLTTPLYVLASETDHIAPWYGAYRTTELVGGPSRFILARSGHIAGMVSPPGDAKARYRIGGVDGEQRSGSWWEDWAAWAAERSGERVSPPDLSQGEAAPGSYVRG
jgi:polyhydroxyalkanoate synthase